MKEAQLYKKLKDKTVQCRICEHKCKLKHDRTGICGIRKNIDGKLYLLTHGTAISHAIDPIEKKPLFHFLPGTEIYSIATVGCNLKCDFCQNADIAQFAKAMNQIDGFPLSPKQIVENTLEADCPSIAYTYTEPTVFFEYTYDTMKLARKKDLKNIYVSNGYFTSDTLEKLKNNLDGINIDLKSFNKEFYQKYCGSKRDIVLRNIESVAKTNIWLELTTLLIPGKNDSEEEIEQIADFIYNINPLIPWHISRFFPSYRMDNVPATPLKTLKKAYDIGIKRGLKHVYAGNAPSLHLENTYCHSCGTLLIKRDNYFTVNVHYKKGKCKNCGCKLPGVM